MRTAALAAALALAGCADDAAVVVFAAASATDVAQAAAERAEPTAGPVVVSAAATSTLARQIAAGAPAGVFVAADGRWVDWLEAEGVAVARRARLARGRLVVVGRPARSPAPTLAEALGGAGRIALGDPEHVPAGIYARTALEEAGLWSGVRDRVAPQADARAALAAVEAGAVEVAMVYASDARASDRVRVLHEVEAAPPVVYEGALLDGAGAGARAVFEALSDEELWRAHGFDAAR